MKNIDWNSIYIWLRIGPLIIASAFIFCYWIREKATCRPLFFFGIGLVVSFLMHVFFEGNAILGGKIETGKYFVGHHGKYWQVSSLQFFIAAILEIFFWFMYFLAFVTECMMRMCYKNNT